jgi:hypothetical protein
MKSGILLIATFAVLCLLVPVGFYLTVPLHEVAGVERAGISIGDNKDSRLEFKEWAEKSLEEDAVLVVPEELMLADPLKGDRFKIVPVSFYHLDRNGFDMLTGVIEGKRSYVLLPQWARYGLEPRVLKQLETWDYVKQQTEELESFGSNAVLADYLYLIKIKDPVIEVRKINQVNQPFQVMSLWDRDNGVAKQVSPSFFVMGKRGRATLDYRKEEEINILVVTQRSRGKLGKRICQLGFRVNEHGFEMPIPTGEYVHFMMDVKVPLCDGLKESEKSGSHIFIQDFVEANKTWERETYFIPAGGWYTCFVSKRIRRDASGLEMGIYFKPAKNGRQLMIRDAKVLFPKHKMKADR